jgi:hypothetical protein
MPGFSYPEHLAAQPLTGFPRTGYIKVPSTPRPERERRLESEKRAIVGRVRRNSD